MEILKTYRAKIDALDDQIVDLIAERFGVILEVADIKFEHNIPAVLQDRVDEVRERNVARAKEKGIDFEFVENMYRELIQRSCDMEDDIIRSKENDTESASEKRSA